MGKENTIEVIQKCIDELQNMTQEEFMKKLEERGLLNREYPDEKYIDSDFVPFADID